MPARAARIAALMLGIGFALIAGGFAAVMAALAEVVRPVMGVVVGGLFVMAAGAITCVVGLARFVFRRPTAEELAGASPAEMRSWHFTRFGLVYFGLVIFGVPVAAAAADRVWPGQGGPVALLAVVVYGGALLALVAPPVCRLVFYVPPTVVAQATQPAPAPRPEPVLGYLVPLFAVAYAGLFALGLVLTFTSDDPKARNSGGAGMVMGAVGLAVCAVPSWRRKLLRPRGWRG